MSKADEIIAQLTRIADALENINRPRSWTGAYGSAESHFNPANLGAEFEDTFKAHSAYFDELIKYTNRSSDRTSAVTRRFTPELMRADMAKYLHSTVFTDSKKEYCDGIAMNVVNALQVVGMWDQ